MLGGSFEFDRSSRSQVKKSDHIGFALNTDGNLQTVIYRRDKKIKEINLKLNMDLEPLRRKVAELKEIRDREKANLERSEEEVRNLHRKIHRKREENIRLRQAATQGKLFIDLEASTNNVMTKAIVLSCSEMNSELARLDAYDKEQARIIDYWNKRNSDKLTEFESVGLKRENAQLEEMKQQLEKKVQGQEKQLQALVDEKNAAIQHEYQIHREFFQTKMAKEKAIYAAQMKLIKMSLSSSTGTHRNTLL